MSAKARLDVNVALNRPAYQISTYTYLGVSYHASYANDGNHGTSAQHDRCAVSEIVTNPWWAVDLGVPLYVYGVKFTNRDALGKFVLAYAFNFSKRKSRLLNSTGCGD